MYPWTIVIADLQGNQIVPEIINPDNRRWAASISNMATWKFDLKTNNPALHVIRHYGYDVLVKAYYGAALLFHGPLVTAQRVEDSSNKSVSCTAADPFWRWSKRHLNQSSTIQLITAASRGELLKGVVDSEHLTEGDTGVRTTNLPMRAGSANPSYSMPPFKALNEFVSDIRNGVGGFEWQMSPIEYQSGKIADLVVGDVIGARRENVIFSKGIAENNVVHAEDLTDLSAAANKIFHIAESGVNAPGAPVVTGINQDSINRRGVMTDIISSPLTDTILRQALVDRHAEVRGGWRNTYSITPAVYNPAAPYQVPQLGRDFDIGDVLRARASADNPDDRQDMWFDGYFRVWGAEMAPDKTGKISMSFTIIQDDSS